MIINDVFNNTDIPVKESHFLKPPSDVYMVYLDDVTTYGPDGINSIYFHDYALEVYEPYKNDEAIAKIEKALNAAGVEWTKSGRTWLTDEQRYMTVYNFGTTEKRGIKNE